MARLPSLLDIQILEVYCCPMNIDDFSNDPHAATYVGALERFPEARDRLFAILTEDCSATALMVAERLGHPALCGIVHQIEADPDIRAVLEAGDAGRRFRQAVGVAVRLRMNQLGWASTGTKGTVTSAEFFTKAERYAA